MAKKDYSILRESSIDDLIAAVQERLKDTEYLSGFIFIVKAKDQKLKNEEPRFAVVQQGFSQVESVGIIKLFQNAIEEKGLEGKG